MTTSRSVLGGLFAPAAVILVAACASTPSGDDADAFVGMTIDLERMQVTTPSWISDLVDCSDGAVQCVEAPGHFIVSMVRECEQHAPMWSAGGYDYVVAALGYESGLRTGIYMSAKYPHVHWVYGGPAGRNYYSWARTQSTPAESGWDPRETLERLSVRVVGQFAPFQCR